MCDWKDAINGSGDIYMPLGSHRVANRQPKPWIGLAFEYQKPFSQHMAAYFRHSYPSSVMSIPDE
jgi:hypothetical protein